MRQRELSTDQLSGIMEKTQPGAGEGRGGFDMGEAVLPGEPLSRRVDRLRGTVLRG